MPYSLIGVNLIAHSEKLVAESTGFALREVILD